MTRLLTAQFPVGGNTRPAAFQSLETPGPQNSNPWKSPALKIPTLGNLSAADFQPLEKTEVGATRP